MASFQPPPAMHMPAAGGGPTGRQQWSPSTGHAGAEKVSRPPSDARGATAFHDMIRRSAALLYRMPTTQNSIQYLVSQDPAKADVIGRFACQCWPIAGEKFDKLLQSFIHIKQRHGTRRERDFYHDMTVPKLADRLLRCRPLVFYTSRDDYVLQAEAAAAIWQDLAWTGRSERLMNSKHDVGFDIIGSSDEVGAMQLKNLLSYDEMQLSALLSVSCRTLFINDGDRNNCSRPANRGTFQPDGVYVGVVGARFERRRRMEWQHILITPEQNTEENGYGQGNSRNPILKLFAQHYLKDGSNFPTHAEAMRGLADPTKGYELLRHAHDLPRGTIFNKIVYMERMRLAHEPFLLEADARGKQEGRKAYCHVVGLGLGAWCVVASLQTQLNVHAVLDIIARVPLPNVSDVDFSWFQAWSNPVKSIKKRFHNVRMIRSRRGFACELHGLPGGTPITIHQTTRNPAERLEDPSKLLVAMYAWDSNSYPGNEYWMSQLNASGDPAAACCSLIPQLQDPNVNVNVNGSNLRMRALGCPEMLPQLPRAPPAEASKPFPAHWGHPPVLAAGGATRLRAYPERYMDDLGRTEGPEQIVRWVEAMLRTDRATMSVEFGPSGGQRPHTVAPTSARPTEVPTMATAHTGGHQPYATPHAPAASEQIYPSIDAVAPGGGNGPPPAYAEQQYNVSANHAQVPTHTSPHSQYHASTASPVSPRLPSGDRQLSNQSNPAPYEVPVSAVPTNPDYVPAEKVVHEDPPEEVPVEANRKPRVQIAPSGERMKMFVKLHRLVERCSAVQRYLFTSAHHRSNVENFLASDDFQRQADSMMLLYARAREETQSFEVAVQANVQKRLPIPFQEKLNNMQRKIFKETLGFDFHKHCTNPKYLRYAVAGEVKVFYRGDSVGTWGHSVVHVWGPNFEEPKCPDFKHVYMPCIRNKQLDTKRFVKACMEIYREIFGLVATAAERLQANVVRVPGLGLGVGTTALSKTGAECVEYAFDQSVKFARKNYPRFKWDLRYPFNKKKPSSNLFQAVSDHERVLFVNAWDDTSFIGRGLDTSINAMMADGDRKDGLFGNNTSILHNCFFVPHVASPTYWVPVDVAPHSLPQPSSSRPAAPLSPPTEAGLAVSYENRWLPCFVHTVARQITVKVSKTNMMLNTWPQLLRPRKPSVVTRSRNTKETVNTITWKPVGHAVSYQIGIRDPATDKVRTMQSLRPNVLSYTHRMRAENPGTYCIRVVFNEKCATRWSRDAQ